jgi:uncharacterized integral membrane protein
MTEEERPAAVEETAFRRRLRHTHRTGLWVAALGALAVLVYLILLIVENSRPVTVHFVFGTGHTRLIWLIIVCGLLGWCLGIATSAIIRRRTRRPRR